MSGTNSLTGNLKRHLDKNHPNKVFTNEIFREKLSIWIAVNDKPFTVVDCAKISGINKNLNNSINIESIENDYFSSLFGFDNNDYHNEDELEDYLQKPIVLPKTDPLK
ncbi:894_t:CDS:2 [Funneliformis geosporum]|uniref:894_t:CDS:1 n=1 Tax=Funneliformis geosporum TaxID=1117311 RepID=A0A9W4SRF2_9GLOM|nr:894_t:CDS:2 [Funneliformis geosporum]